MIAAMVSHTLSVRTVLLSWLTSAVAWPLAWMLLAVAQGVGVVLLGGGWIGVAVPLGQHPWGLVNEPSVAFASSRGALFGYWLAPMLLAVVVAVALPVSVSVRRWWGELFVFHLALASAVLGLGWAPALGMEDGPIAGLARFWEVDSSLVVVVAAVVGVATVQLAVVRLGSHLWPLQGGPRRLRRITAVLTHTIPPALVWVALSALLGWPLLSTSCLAMAAVLVGAWLAAWLWLPRAPLRTPPEVGARGWIVATVAALLVAALAAWAGSPAKGGARALLWGSRGMTNNVRSNMTVVPLLGQSTRPRLR
jgi:hypothetical protein